MRAFILLSFLSLLGGCLSHETSIVRHDASQIELPEIFVILQNDGDNARILRRVSGGYTTLDGSDEVTIRMARLVNFRGYFLIEEDKSSINGASSNGFQTYLFRQDSPQQVTQISASGDVTTLGDLVRTYQSILTQNEYEEVTYTIYDVTDPARVAALEAEGARREAERESESPPEEQQQPIQQSGQFYFSVEEDPIDGTTKQYVFGFPEGVEPGQPPFIRFGCYGRNDRWPMGLTVEWGQPLSDSFNGQLSEPVATITTRFGSAPAIVMGWSLSGAQNQTYAPSSAVQLGGSLASGIVGAILPGNGNANVNFSWSVRDMHRAFWRNDQVVLRGFPLRGGDITMVFDSSNFNEVARNFAPHCQF